MSDTCFGYTGTAYFSPTGGGYCDSYLFTISDVGTGHGSEDYDCDGVVNSSDTTPGFVPIDTDSDGVPDENDLWPNDSSCPGSQARWKRVAKTSLRGKDCYVLWYEDSLGVCKDLSTGQAPIEGGRVGAYCPGMTQAEADDPSLWNFQYMDQGPYTWADLFGEGPTETGETIGGTGETGQIVAGLAGILAKDGQILGKLDEIYGRQTTTTGTVVDKLSEILAKEGEVKQAIIDKQVAVNLGGVESRLDATNLLLTDVKDKIPEVGDPGGLQNIDTSGLEGNPEVGEEVVSGHKGTITTWLTGVYNTAYSSSIINSVISGSAIQVSGAVSYIDCDLGEFGQLHFDFATYSTILEIIGDFLVAFAGLAGLIAVFRD